MTPAVPRSRAGTTSHTSVDDRNARRRISARSGTKRWSPARVTPPATTTIPGFSTLMMLAIPAPSSLAVSFITSLA